MEERQRSVHEDPPAAAGCTEEWGWDQGYSQSGLALLRALEKYVHPTYSKATLINGFF